MNMFTQMLKFVTDLFVAASATAEVVSVAALSALHCVEVAEQVTATWLDTSKEDREIQKLEGTLRQAIRRREVETKLAAIQ